MSGCHEPIKDTKQLIIEFVDNCKERLQRLEKLIRLNEDGLTKCFEWSEKSETKLNGLVNLFDVVNKKQDGNSIRIEKLEKHIEKVHDLVKLEDRITASDVLNRLMLLESHKNYQIDENRKVSRRLDQVESGYISRIDILGGALDALSEENDKLMKMEARLITLEEELVQTRVQFIGKLENEKKVFLFVCPVCHGNGEWQLDSIEEIKLNENKKFKACHSCEGKGIIWG